MSPPRSRGRPPSAPRSLCEEPGCSSSPTATPVRTRQLGDVVATPNTATPGPNLKVLVNHEVAAEKVEEAEATIQLGLDGEKTLSHDLLHAFLRGKRANVLPHKA